MHVALLIPTLDQIGGAERQVIFLAEGLAARGWRVTVVMQVGEGGERGSQLRRIGVDVISLRMRHSLLDLRGWLRWWLWLHRARPQIVHAHLPHAIWMARWARRPGTVQMETLHTPALGPTTRQWGFRISSRLTDCTTAVSYAVADAYRQAGLAAAERLVVLPNGLATDHWKPDAEARARVRQESAMGEGFLWLSVGRLEPVKDYSRLLRVFAALPETAHLWIAGSGSEEEKLREEARRAGVQDRVRLLGFQENVLPRMQAADGFVLSSLWEGLPMVLLEAASCQLPIVAPRLAGIQECVVEDETGYLCDPGSDAALLVAMQRLMQADTAQREAMGSRGRERILKCYAQSAVLDQWESLYRRLLN